MNTGGSYSWLIIGLAAAQIVFADPPGHSPTLQLPPELNVVIPSTRGGPGQLLMRQMDSLIAHISPVRIRVEYAPDRNIVTGANMVAQSRDDLFLLYDMSIVITGASQMRLPFEMERSFVHVGLIAWFPMVVLVSNRSRYRSLSDISGELRKAPHSLMWASDGVTSAGHLCAQMIQHRLSIQANQAPYRGTEQALKDLADGRAQVACVDTLAAMPMLETGLVRAIAVTSETRLPTLPDIPTAIESGVSGMALWNLYGIAASRQTRSQSINGLKEALNRVLVTEAFQMFLKPFAGRQATQTQFTSPGDFIIAEITRWRPTLTEIKFDAY